MESVGGVSVARAAPSLPPETNSIRRVWKGRRGGKKKKKKKKKSRKIGNKQSLFFLIKFLAQKRGGEMENCNNKKRKEKKGVGVRDKHVIMLKIME